MGVGVVEKGWKVGPTAAGQGARPLLGLCSEKGQECRNDQALPPLPAPRLSLGDPNRLLAG